MIMCPYGPLIHIGSRPYTYDENIFFHLVLKYCHIHVLHKHVSIFFLFFYNIFVIYWGKYSLNAAKFQKPSEHRRRERQTVGSVPIDGAAKCQTLLVSPSTPHVINIIKCTRSVHVVHCEYFANFDTAYQ